MTDTIRRADAINAFWEDSDIRTAEVRATLKALPSAEAEPTVIRAKTFMRKEDFDKWAEDIKRQGENVICIPCDAEVVSGDSLINIDVIRELDNCEYCEECIHMEVCRFYGTTDCNYKIKQPEKCIAYKDGGDCCYPVENCSECPKHQYYIDLEREKVES